MSLTHGSKPSNTEPRKRTRPTKRERKLAERLKDFERSAKGPMPTQFHKPGSQNGRK